MDEQAGSPATAADRPVGNLVFIERLSEAIRVNGEYVPIDYVERQAGDRGRALRVRDLEPARRDQRPARGVFVTDPGFDLARTTAVIGTLPKIMRPVEIMRIAALPRDTGVNKVQRRRLAGEARACAPCALRLPATETAMTAFLKYEQRGHVVTLTMSQPEQRNPLTGNTAVVELLAAVDRISADGSVRAVILTGEGPAFLRAAISAR